MKFKIKFADQIVGALSITAIAAIIFFTFFIASTQKWFVKKHHFFTEISSANSVSEGMSLQYKGFAIGKVKKITLSENDTVQVYFYVLDEYIDRVTQGSIVELSVSPIGLGSSFIFYQGNSSKLIVDNSFIPEKSSAKAKEMIKEGQVIIVETNDTINTIIGSVTSLINHIDELVQQINELIAGNEEIPLAKTINNVNRILRQVSALLAGDESVPMASIVNDLNTTVDTLNSILSDVNGLTADPQGLVPKLLETEESKGTFDKLYAALDTTIQDLNGISGSLDSEMPQVSILLAQVQTLLKQVQDVMVGLKNNPLLKKGVPERTEQQAATPKLREESF
ncbi:MAG: MCE family protein [Treponema sp.]|nr:MCE family protein [Treponema sp.]MBR4790651.1 MCE family protein [Treponema sp.]